MKTKPILFSGPMVRAILEGRKVQTRRIVKQQPSESRAHLVHLVNVEDRGIGFAEGRVITQYCPYGKPGDLLWVRETFIAGVAVGGYQPHVDPDSEPDGETVDVIYRADDVDNERTAGPWTPSIFMPRWASRLTLRITNVRVERLQEISEEDAEAEGAEPVLVPPDGGSCPHRQGFLELWESINGPGLWDENPWVWVVEFDQIHQNVDCITA